MSRVTRELVLEVALRRILTDPWNAVWLVNVAKAALAQPATGGDEYRRGVEDAARVVDACHIERFNGEVIRLDAVVAAIRALSPPPAPTPVEEP